MTDLLANAVPVDVAKPEAEDTRLWSVTTLISALDKPALVPWAANMTAAEAVRVAKRLPQMVEEDGPAETTRWLASARFRKPKGQARTATELGTAVHDACERYAISGERPEVDDEVRPFLDRFTAWVQAFQPEYLAAEMTVYNDTYSYAGTLDAIVRINGTVVLADYKTSAKADEPGRVRGPYPEVSLQMAAYRFAEMAATWRPRRHEFQRRRYYLVSPDERELAVPVPEVEGAIAISITPTHCTAYPVRCDKEIWTAFLYVEEAARWQFETSKTVIGDPLVVA
ncbi:MAG: hypothetical protein ACRDYZ_11855 [Acidimicrobiales bacterium]